MITNKEDVKWFKNSATGEKKRTEPSNSFFKSWRPERDCVTGATT